MTTRHSIQLAVFSLLLLAGATQAAESLSVLLQKGIYAEETEGNLDAAIKIYEGIVKEGDANRSLVAQAQYRLGVCQSKKGMKVEAVGAFRNLITRFPDQTELLTKAQTQLAQLGERGSVTVRQVWNPAPDIGGGVSPDGNLLSFVDWDTGDLAVRDLTTGMTLRLTDKGSWDKSDAFAEESVFSPEGQRVIYSWFDGKEAYELRIERVKEPNKPVVLPKGDWGWVAPAAWSPDGNSIAAVTFTMKSKHYDIVTITLNPASTRILKSCGSERPDVAEFSPDGQFLVCSFQAAGAKQHDLFALDVATGAESPLLVHPADDVALCWTPDRGALIFKSDRRGTTDLWMLPIRVRTPSLNELTLLKTDFGDSSSLGMTASGSLYFGTSVNSAEVYTATLDLQNGKLLAAPQEVQRRINGPTSWSSVSRDGRFLAYYSRSQKQAPVTIVDLESGKEREFTNVPRLKPMGSRMWWGTEKSLLIFGVRPDDQFAYMLLNTETGELETIATTDLEETEPEVSPSPFFRGEDFYFVKYDAKKKAFVLIQKNTKTGSEVEHELVNATDPRTKYTVLIPHFDDPKLTHFIRGTETSKGKIWEAFLKNIETGEETLLYRSPDPFKFQSGFRNGRLALLQFGGSELRLIVVDNSTHPAKQLFSMALPKNSNLNWGIEKEDVLLLSRRPGDSDRADNVLWTISAVTGEMKKTELVLRNMRIIARHPDGKRMFLQKTESHSEVWALENFLPPVAVAK